MADSEFLVAQLESPIITLIIDSGGRTLRSPGIVDDHKAAGVDYQSDYQNLQVRSSRTQGSPRGPLHGICDNRFDNPLARTDSALPGILDDHKAAGVDYQSDYQNDPFNMQAQS